MSFKILQLYFWTLTYLKASQVFFFIIRKFVPKIIIRKGTRGDVCPREGFGLRHPGLSKYTSPDNNMFTFINISQSIDLKNINWRSSNLPKLWIYNLHYFDYLTANFGSELCIKLINDWIHNNPIGTTNAWDPFPISLRLVNWLKFLSFNQVDKQNRKIMTDSMAAQSRWLIKYLEYHLLGNHLFKNGKALVFAGLFFQGNEAEKWLEKGIDIIENEIGEQVLLDGGHHERSPMYHAMILEDCLDLLNIAYSLDHDSLAPLVPRLERTTKKMIRFLVLMCHPDGRISLFNDSALGIEAEPNQLLDYYTWLTGNQIVSERFGAIALPHTGYYILAPDGQNKMIIDCGYVGPDYQPGHAHCDTLSFELSLKGRRVIVDSGCCQYEDGPIRQYNRGNAGHNTLTIDGQNQSEVWAAHRCARRAYPTLVAFEEEADGSLIFKGSHNGYGRLPGRPKHQRAIHWRKNHLKITDRIGGEGRHHILSTLHLHPDLDLQLEDDGIIVSGDSEALAKISAAGGEATEILEGWYCPEFNRQLACKKLAINFEAALPAETGWLIKIL